MKEGIQQIVGIIEHGSREEIWEAAKQLESLAADTCSSLLRLLKEADEIESRAAAAYVLGFSRYSSARVPLEEVLDNLKEDASVRGHAAEALAYVQSKESTVVLLRHLNDDDTGVRYWCIFALGQIGDPRALTALKQVAKSVGDQLYNGHSLRSEALDAATEILRQSE
jgi:HEAT repeat protein